jgi:hypothetical protein
MVRLLDNIKWEKFGSLYGAKIGWDKHGNNIYIYNTSPSLPYRADILQYGDALLIVNGKHKITFLRARASEVIRVEGGNCLWFGSSYVFDYSDFNEIVIILEGEGTSLIEVRDGNSIYTIEVKGDDEIIEYPNLSIEAFFRLQQKETEE